MPPPGRSCRPDAHPEAATTCVFDLFSIAITYYKFFVSVFISKISSLASLIIYYFLLFSLTSIPQKMPIGQAVGLDLSWLIIKNNQQLPLSVQLDIMAVRLVDNQRFCVLQQY